MSRLVLLCPEPLGHGHPAGVGIRFLEFARALRAAGHSVTVLSPDAGAVEGCVSGTLAPESIRGASAASDAAVLQGHIANEFFAHGAKIPAVVDLYDPYVVENLHYFGEHGEKVFLHDHGTLIRSLRNGDFFLCASEAQRFFYLGMLIAVGRLNPLTFERDRNASDLLAIAPFGVPPMREVPAKTLAAPALLFGGIYDWYTPKIAIDAVAIARATVPGLTLSFNRHPNAASTPQGVAGEAGKYVSDRRYGSFIRFEAWTPYDQRDAFYDRFSAAILTFPQSVETDLAMRTRILDYLWAGLPIISSSGRGTNELIERHGAGRVVDSQDPAAFALAIIEMFASRQRFDAMVAGAASFARENQWEQTLRPLLDFCRAPRADETKHAFTTTEAVGPASATGSILERLRRRIGGRT